MAIGMLKPKLRRDEIKPGEVLCTHCTAKCCRYFALPIEDPTTPDDWEFVRWYLLHGGATVFKEDGNWYLDRKSTRLNSSHIQKSRMPSSA